MVVKRRQSKIETIEFRLEQIELALMNLMYVVANPEKELSGFKKSMEKAEKVSKKHQELFSIIINEEGAEAW